MPVFNRRDRDDKGAGKIRLDETEAEETKKSISKKTILFGAGGILAAGLVATFLLTSGGSDDKTPDVVTQPDVITEPVDVTPTPIDNTPVIAVQSEADKVSQKISSIQNRDSCLYEAFVGTAGREVRAGSDFSFFGCLYDEGGIGVLITEGEWAGTRVNFLPREGTEGNVSVQVIGESDFGADGRTIEYHLLPRGDRLSYSASMARPEAGDNIYISDNAARFAKTVSQGGQTANAFIIAGNPAGGVFEVEIPNGDVYKIDLNNGDFYADSLFLNCPSYQYGAEASCPRDSFQPVEGSIPQLER